MENKKEIKEKESLLYPFPENYPGKETADKIDALENLSDEEAIKELDKLVEKNDFIVSNDEISAVVSQSENLIYFEIEDIYSNPKKKAFRNRFKMRKNPPTLSLKDNKGQEVKILLTENLTEELIQSLTQVKRAYYGFYGPAKKEKQNAIEFVKENKIKIIAGFAISVLLIYLLS